MQKLVPLSRLVRKPKQPTLTFCWQGLLLLYFQKDTWECSVDTISICLIDVLLLAICCWLQASCKKNRFACHTFSNSFSGKKPCYWWGGSKRWILDSVLQAVLHWFQYDDAKNEHLGRICVEFTKLYQVETDPISALRDLSVDFSSVFLASNWPNVWLDHVWNSMLQWKNVEKIGKRYYELSISSSWRFSSFLNFLIRSLCVQKDPSHFSTLTRATRPTRRGLKTASRVTLPLFDVIGKEPSWSQNLESFSSQTIVPWIESYQKIASFFRPNFPQLSTWGM